LFQGQESEEGSTSATPEDDAQGNGEETEKPDYNKDDGFFDDEHDQDEQLRDEL
jgi:hypothetical protein